MPALPIVAGVVRCTYSGAMPSGKKWANVWHFRFKGGAAAPALADLNALTAITDRLYVGGAYGAGTAWIAALCSTTVTCQQALLYLLDGSSPPVVHPVGVTGSAAGNQEASEVAHVVTLQTAKRGRSYRGRIYLPAIKQAQVQADGSLAGATTGNFVTQLYGVQGALGGATTTPFWEMGVCSYKLAHFEPLLSVKMDGLADVIRHRKG